MQRPKVITALSILYLLMGLGCLLLAVPARRLQEGYLLFGSWVSATTYMYWIAMMGVVWLGFAFAFHQGLSLGLWVYLGLKASHWGVNLLSGNLGWEALPGLLLEGGLVYLLWRERDWFRH